MFTAYNSCRIHFRLYCRLETTFCCTSSYRLPLSHPSLFSFLSFHSLSHSSFDLSVVFIFLHAPPTTISAAKNKPIIAEPEIQASQSLEGVTGFLLLMSEGLIKALESAHGPEQANQVGAFTYPINLLSNYIHNKLL